MFSLVQMRHPALKCWCCLTVIHQCVCTCICRCMGLISFLYVQRGGVAIMNSSSELDQFFEMLLWNGPKYTGLRRSCSKLLAILLWCPRVKTRFASPRLLNFILSSLMVIIWGVFIGNWLCSICCSPLCLFVTVNLLTPVSCVLVDSRIVEIMRGKGTTFNCSSPMFHVLSCNSVIVEPV